MDIDFVIMWVDGNDPEWKRQRDFYKYGANSVVQAEECRYRDWGILKYWFRSVEMNAPWVRKIHFVTCGQIPDFLNTNHPKLHMVSHSDFMAPEDLPTFSSRAIEVNLHRIKGLSEYFVMFNDDFYLNQPVNKHIFFQKGKPCYLYKYRRMKKPSAQSDAYSHARYHSAKAVYRHFSRWDMIKRHPGKVVHPRYGLYNNLWNLYCLPQRNLMDFMDVHVAIPFLKSTMRDVWEAEPALLKHTSHNRFRENESVNQCIFRYWDLARGHFIPANPDRAIYGIESTSMKHICRDILKGEHMLICINDTEHTDDYDGNMLMLQRAFEKRYPQKSSFER